MPYGTRHRPQGGGGPAQTAGDIRRQRRAALHELSHQRGPQVYSGGVYANTEAPATPLPPLGPDRDRLVDEVRQRYLAGETKSSIAGALGYDETQIAYLCHKHKIVRKKRES